MAKRRRSTRLLLSAALALIAVASKGCAAGADPPSKVNALRVLVVTASSPYADPGDAVRFKMEVHNGQRGGGSTPIQIAWFGGCFDPPGDLYYACFEPLAQGIDALLNGGPVSSDLQIAFGTLDPSAPPDPSKPSIAEFNLSIPEDIISRRPLPQAGPYYGIAYVFFAACAGTLAPVAPTEGVASLPFGCFDADGNELDADSFVPGYTQIYSFNDGRPNTNPTPDGLLFDGALVKTDDEDPLAMPVVKRCDLSDDERRNPGCSAPDPYETCESYGLDVLVGEPIAEPDASSPSPKGGVLDEIVWVDYLADGGDVDGDVKLINGAVEGYHPNHGVRWIPPKEPGIATLWAIVRDNRGGASALKRSVRVE